MKHRAEELYFAGEVSGMPKDFLEICSTNPVVNGDVLLYTPRYKRESQR
jgi:hypothetical protein